MSKVLTNRLKHVLPSIISPFQAAFVGHRRILDDILIVNELIDTRKRMRKKGLMFKIFFLEKAYDHVDWDLWTTC